jgi:hypothetical protein
MGFLDRLRGTAATPTRSAVVPSPPGMPTDPLTPIPDANGWYGRRFRTAASVEECHAHARALLVDGVSDPGVFEARWADSGPSPDVLFGIRNTQYGVLYVAIWQSGSMVAGQREVAVVPTRFNSDAPMPLAGQWKLRDGGLTSIGHVTEFSIGPAVEA